MLHDGEVFAVITHTAAPGTAYPLITEFQDLMSDECVPVLETYTGMDIVALVVGRVRLLGLLSKSGGWNSGTRNVTCYVIRADGLKMTGSVRAGAATPAPR